MLTSPLKQAIIVESPAASKSVPLDRIALFNEDGSPFALGGGGGGGGEVDRGLEIIQSKAVNAWRAKGYSGSGDIASLVDGQGGLTVTAGTFVDGYRIDGADLLGPAIPTGPNNFTLVFVGSPTGNYDLFFDTSGNYNSTVGSIVVSPTYFSAAMGNYARSWEVDIPSPTNWSVYTDVETFTAVFRIDGSTGTSDVGFSNLPPTRKTSVDTHPERGAYTNTGLPVHIAARKFLGAALFDSALTTEEIGWVAEYLGGVNTKAKNDSDQLYAVGATKLGRYVSYIGSSTEAVISDISTLGSAPLEVSTGNGPITYNFGINGSDGVLRGSRIVFLITPTPSGQPTKFITFTSSFAQGTNGALICSPLKQLTSRGGMVTAFYAFNQWILSGDLDPI